MKRTFLFILFWIAAGASALAQKIVVSASVSQPQILIGEPLQLTLRVQMPEAASITWFVTDTFPHFEIQHRSAIDTVRSGAGEQILVQNIRITSWDSGRWNLPSFSVNGSNRTAPIAIGVTYSPMDPAQPYHDVKDVLAVQRPGAQNWIWYLVGAALLLVFFLLLFPGRKKKEKATTASPETAYREAIRGLDMLQKRSGELPVKEFYTELVGLFRNYLVRRQDYQSSSKTTSDLQQQLPEWGLQKDAAARLLESLQLSDAVKFARFEASAEERKASVAHIRETIVELERKKPG
ncbi:hypothetical protein SAMN05444008_11417 [Cnuella takakiae]|uniref:Oxygen tolerance n=1 Tax=Cnuella takakiae TaxID=1302690 RepID=A0A1M5FHY6_9BACT|nr:hypothetical protein [Cnuella takakiae]OLY93759.1 hypothetical protein BUE76_19120 [Cnuella takakiae]SHF91160.1 hypothetical protein SAMN05444008_11417 [Cnuella takakiae]